jgi:hypothetical protein
MSRPPDREVKMTKRQPSILEAVAEASRSAHRWRDRAIERYEKNLRTKYRISTAAYAAEQKRHYYDLKERGIMTLHRSGELRYAGTSPQGMAIYEYQEGGMKCFHSCLHPVGVERKPIEGHPELLKVAAKKQVFRLSDVEELLRGLPGPGDDYSRVPPPSIKDSGPRVAYGFPRVCYSCGNEDHIARECPLNDLAWRRGPGPDTNVVMRVTSHVSR